MAVRIYTRTGDSGETGLFGGQRVSKDSIRVEAYGAVDELNASIGAVRASVSAISTAIKEIDDLLYRIQHDLFLLGADLATPQSSSSQAAKSIARMNPERIAYLEQQIDHFEAELPPLKQFILPGGTAFAAALHVARTVCRRAERRTITLSGAEAEEDPINPEAVKYLNRLSDLLFVLARAANHRVGVPDTPWNPEA
jgi:cob(I)alamin adenosyltransferase